MSIGHVYILHFTVIFKKRAEDTLWILNSGIVKTKGQNHVKTNKKDRGKVSGSLQNTKWKLIRPVSSNHSVKEIQAVKY